MIFEINLIFCSVLKLISASQLKSTVFIDLLFVSFQQQNMILSIFPNVFIEKIEIKRDNAMQFPGILLIKCLPQIIHTEDIAVKLTADILY